MMYLGDNPIGLATSIPIFSDKVEIEYGEYTPETDIPIYNSTLFIPHNIGTIPDFVIVAADIPESDTYTVKYLGLLSYCRANSESYHVFIRVIKPGTSNWATSSGITTNTYTQEVQYLSDSNFKIIGPSEAYVKANVTYHYIVGKFKEVTPNA